MKVNITFRGLDKATREIAKLRETAAPYAMRDALNTAAFELRRTWSEEIKRTFTLRNQFTARRALEVRKAGGKDMNEMRAHVGSIAEFMPLQEDGGTVRGRSGHRPIPGPVAGGQAPGGKRTRLVRAARKLSAIAAAKAPAGRTRHQRNAIALAIARKQAKAYAVLERPRGGKGLFLLGGGKRKITTRLVWDLSRGSARVPPHRTLGPALEQLKPRFEDIALAAVFKQLKRHRLLGF